jgi:hypothetical protein
MVSTSAETGTTLKEMRFQPGSSRMFTVPVGAGVAAGLAVAVGTAVGVSTGAGVSVGVGPGVDEEV